ncbi:MAG TPA: hypothetical protein VJN18_02880 [Polyangiaceae bacterium]|nr:hypothetical protein [Polyangiaceae bacterium]
MVEAVIVIPVLVLIWASLYYLGELFATQQALEAKARSCAWLYSANNCQVVPDGCDQVLNKSEGSADDVEPKVTDALGEGGRKALNGADSKSIIGTIVGDLVGGPLLAAFTSSVDAKVTRDVEQPGAFGGGLKTVTGRYHLACNLEPTTPEKMAEKAWESLGE